MSYRVQTGRMGPYETLELRDESAGNRVTLSPDRGGMAMAFSVAGRELLYLEEDSFLDPGRSVRGGIPILFPIAGPVHGDQYLAHGQPRTMRQHGVARLQPWRIRDTGVETGPWAELELVSSDATRVAFPWDFRLRFTWRLQGTRLRIEQEFVNDSDTPMPMQVGLHPYFRVDDKEAVRWEIPADRFVDTARGTSSPFTGRFDFSQGELDLAFLDVQEPRASMEDDHGRITVDFDLPYRHVIFWTLPGKDFCCLEPWSAPRFAMNSGTDLVHVEPGEMVGTTVTIDWDPKTHP